MKKEDLCFCSGFITGLWTTSKCSMSYLYSHMLWFLLPERLHGICPLLICCCENISAAICRANQMKGMKALKNPFKTTQNTLAEFIITISVLTYKKKKHSIISLQWYFLFHQISTLDIALIMKLTNDFYSQFSIHKYFYRNSSICNHLLLSTYFLAALCLTYQL